MTPVGINFSEIKWPVNPILKAPLYLGHAIIGRRAAHSGESLWEPISRASVSFHVRFFRHEKSGLISTSFGAVHAG